MGIIIVLMALLIIGFVLFYSYYDNFSLRADILWFFGFFLSCVAVLFLIVSGALISVEHIAANKNYIDMREQKNTIEYRLEQAKTDKSIMVNGGAYNDALEYNEKLRRYKTYGDTFWLGWFYSDKIAELDYIEIIKESDEK